MSNFELNGKKAGDVESKYWKVRTADDSGKRELKFRPIFIVKDLEPGAEFAGGQNKEVECRIIEIIVPDGKGGELKFQMNFVDLYMFIYTVSEEELRQQLQMRYERQAVNIPYEVTFKLDDEEKATGMAKRLITLSVDEITLAIARAGAHKLLKNLKPESTEEYVARKTQELKAKK